MSLKCEILFLYGCNNTSLNPQTSVTSANSKVSSEYVCIILQHVSHSCKITEYCAVFFIKSCISASTTSGEQQIWKQVRTKCKLCYYYPCSVACGCAGYDNGAYSSNLSIFHAWLCLFLQNNTTWRPQLCQDCTCYGEVAICRPTHCPNPNCDFQKVRLPPANHKPPQKKHQDQHCVTCDTSSPACSTLGLTEHVNL